MCADNSNVPKHKQVFVKVNAPVDAGAAGLVSALSRFDSLQTLESCEDIKGWAWVIFVYGDAQKWEDVGRFALGYIGPRIAQELGDRVTLNVHVSTSLLYRAEVAVRVPAIPAAVKLLTKLHAELKN